jgi:hypothetical protein
MQIKKSNSQLIVWIILIFSACCRPAFATESVCPQTDYALESGSLYGCYYAEDIFFGYTIWEACQDYWENKYQKDVKVVGRKKELWVYSPTHAVVVQMKLNRKEFKKKRREYWIAKGREFMRELEKSKATRCVGPDPAMPTQSEETKKDMPAPERPQEIPVAEPTPPSPPAWDEWDAPAPKAKSRD